jgi:hypothetical protein
MWWIEFGGRPVCGVGVAVGAVVACGVGVRVGVAVGAVPVGVAVGAATVAVGDAPGVADAPGVGETLGLGVGVGVARTPVASTTDGKAIGLPSTGWTGLAAVRDRSSVWVEQDKTHATHGMRASRRSLMLSPL